MATLLQRSGRLTVGAVLLASLAWAQSRGTPEDESAIKALVDSQNRVLVQGVGNMADLFAADKVTPESVKTDVRFVRPDVAVLHSYAERVGQIDSTTGKVIPTRKVHSQYVLSKENGKWLIQSELIMDEKQHEGANP